MARLNLKAIEERVVPLGALESYDREFLFELLLAYGKPKGNVTRLRNGSLNVAAEPGREVAQKNVVYFREATGDPLAEVEELRKAAHVVRFSPRFVIVTDYAELVAVDTKTGENLAIPIHNIDTYFAFFLPWAGMEKAQYVAEVHADVKAAERMGKLFDELLAANPDLLDLPHGRHALNVFFTRLLFCFFAEDTGIFGEGQFTTAVGSHTQADGSDVDEFLGAVFTALDTVDTQDKPAYLSAFPYVNGRLFTVSTEHVVPRFTKSARDLLIELGSLMWQEINPDIFGSMFQAIVTPGKRSDLGQHYTSVPNILKTIEPLFLDRLKGELDAGFDSVRKLEELLDRISEIKVFDPACGSGNFLVIAYKELRRLEHAILERLAELDSKHQVLFAESRIGIENFYGIEIDDFAVEVAILSLWIAKHQMNSEFKDKFGVSIPLIPLNETGQIRAGNAARVDWNEVCDNDDGEIYLIGNPPFKGSNEQTADMKLDLSFAYDSRPYSKNQDYVSAWFIKGVDYIVNSRAKLAFISTSAIVRGQQVEFMFPSIFARGIEIGYAYTPFQWENNAKMNAGVTVVVVSLRNSSPSPKRIYRGSLSVEANNINGYLADGDSVIVAARRTRLAKELPPMTYGSKATDGGNLTLDPRERDDLLSKSPEADKYIRSFIGADEFIDGKERFCLWITDDEASNARSIPEIYHRLTMTAQMRSKSRKVPTNKLASVPHRFGESRHQETEAIMFPSISSSRRDYIPIGYQGPSTVISNKGFAVYDAHPWTFALLTSRMHMAWTDVVSGRRREDYQYSNTIVYNNFPVPPLSDEMKERLTVAALRVLDVREYHCEKTLAELYDPDKMPNDLRRAHAEVDALVDSIYSKRGYETDEERLSDLFAMYEGMTAEEAANPAKRSTK